MKAEYTLKEKSLPDVSVLAKIFKISEQNGESKKVAEKGNFERMCHDAPANRFYFRWSN